MINPPWYVSEEEMTWDIISRNYKTPEELQAERNTLDRPEGLLCVSEGKWYKWGKEYQWYAVHVVKEV